VPLTIGSNTITATATDSYGNTDTKTITVYTNDTTQQVELSANITSGISPLTVFFSASISFTPVSYQMDFEGDGVIDYTGTAFENVSFTYNSEGIFYPTITTTDDQGNTYSDTIAITVLNKTEVDTLLKGKWEGMKGAMTEKDFEKSLQFFTDGSKEMYQYNFNLMYTIMDSIIQGMGDIELVEVRGNFAEYEMLVIREGEERSFYIEFIKDGDGIWKINFF